MKKLILIILIISIYSTAFSQIDGNYNYSIGVRAFGNAQSPKILSQTNSQDYRNSYFDGVMIKFNDNQISYRITGNYFRKNIAFNNQCNTCEIAAGLVTDYAFTIGFEKNFNYGRVQPYIGADMGFKSNNFTGEVKTANPKNMSAPYDVDTDKNGFVTSPLVGIKVNAMKQVSFFIESSLSFYYSYERQETIQQDALNTRSFVKFNKWEFLLNPISIGIQVHFSSKN
jgi:hypothetical protein